MLWATAVAAADGVHSSKQVQETVIGVCSSISHPWPALPALLEAALPHAPIERVRFTVSADLQPAIACSWLVIESPNQHHHKPTWLFCLVARSCELRQSWVTDL